jgi:hypothetical protein
MKSCIIVNFWADTEFKRKITVNCLTQLKKTGIDLIYTSKYPITNEINQLVKYSILTSENDLIVLDDLLHLDDINIVNSMSYHTNNFSFYTCPLNYYNVSFSVHTQLISNLKYLKSLGYTHFHYLVGDNIISDEDLGNFKLIEDFIIKTNNKSFFEDIRKRLNGFSSLYWFSEIDFYLESSFTNGTKEEFIYRYSSPPKNSNSLVYENILLQDFGNKNKVVLAVNDNEKYNYLITFKNSKLDLVKSENRDYYSIIPDEQEDKSTIFISSHNGGKYELIINEESNYFNLDKNYWQTYVTNLKEFNIKILHNDTKVINMNIDEKKLNKIKSYSFFA